LSQGKYKSSKEPVTFFQ